MRHCTCCTRWLKTVQMTTVTRNGHISRHQTLLPNSTTAQSREEQQDNIHRTRTIEQLFVLPRSLQDNLLKQGKDGIKTEQESARRRRQRNHTSTVVSAPGHFVRCAVGMEGTRTQHSARVVLHAPDTILTVNDCASIMALHDGGFGKKLASEVPRDR